MAEFGQPVMFQRYLVTYNMKKKPVYVLPDDLIKEST